ncbi:MAG TPA: amidase family protein [Acidimicrobiales bacterium]|nr:amidase family protein [Acidimicrobiales bacterium]
METWASHGRFIQTHRPRLGPGVAARFEQASRTPRSAAQAANRARQELLARLDATLVRGSLLALPSTPSVAPEPRQAAPAKQDLRRRTLMLTCLASLGGLPAVSLPLARANGLPIGVSVLGRPGDDLLVLSATAGCPPLADQ